jgi:hypothetical protein
VVIWFKGEPERFAVLNLMRRKPDAIVCRYDKPRTIVEISLAHIEDIWLAPNTELFDEDGPRGSQLRWRLYRNRPTGRTWLDNNPPQYQRYRQMVLAGRHSWFWP